jgi:hypothetical protein
MKLPFVLGAKERIMLFAGALALAFWAGWAVNGWRLNGKAARVAQEAATEAKEASEAVRDRERQAATLGASVAGSVGQDAQRSHSRTAERENEIDKETNKISVYSQCVATDSVVQQINNAVADANRSTVGIDKAAKDN